MKYVIYKLLFPGGEVYIGKTFRDTRDRWKYGTGYGPNSSVGRAIAKYGWHSVQTFILYENLTKEEASRMEVLEIERHGGINHPLVLNDQSGGDSGFTLSENGKKKLSESLKRVFQEHPEIHDVVRTKVDQYSYDGSTFIASYNSVTDAEAATGICYQHIASCITGERIAAGGFRWVKQGKKLGIIQYKHSNPTNKVKVEQLDKETGEVIAVYESATEAAKAVGLHDGGHISDCLNGRRNAAGGYRWRRLEAV